MTQGKRMVIDLNLTYLESLDIAIKSEIEATQVYKV